MPSRDECGASNFGSLPIGPSLPWNGHRMSWSEPPVARKSPSCVQAMERMRAASAISKEAGRIEGLKIARESLLEVRELIQGVQVSAPFNNVKYALEVFEALPEFGSDVNTANSSLEASY